MQTSDKSMNFESSKPDVLIVNADKEEGVTKNLIKYIKENSNIIEIKNEADAINDALFYRDVNYIIYIPDNYRKDFLDNKNPQIKVKSTGDYQSSLAEMLLQRYLKVANIYLKNVKSEQEIIDNINKTLSKQVDVKITSKLDTNNLTRAVSYYNFANYSILAGCVYVICLILSSFNKEIIRKRTIVSSMNYKTYNINLLFSNSLFAIIMWLFYVLLSFVLLGYIMFTIHGLILLLNSFIFTICSLAIAFLIGNLVNNKNAINGIINVIALGSSFLCGAFVPIEWLPASVLKIAHILPSYWYIQNNELLKRIEVFNLKTMQPILINMGVIVIFTIVFIIITNIIAHNKRKLS